MRYYVLCTSDRGGVQPHIVAEVVRSVIDGDDRDITLASALAGERAAVVTRAELVRTASGRAAIAAWDRGDDTQYDGESDAISSEEDEPRPVLRLVVTAPGPVPHEEIVRVAKDYLALVQNDETGPLPLAVDES